ncbi:MAG: biopolymer transporter ExbD [Gammaproteobacteria bacterium]|jgi:biopolymer transport protein ExbD
MIGRSRYRASAIADLDVTAFINLMVVLVAFFLSSVTYFQFSALQLKIPSSITNAPNPAKALSLEVIIRKGALEVGDRNAGLISRIKNKDGNYDFKALNHLLKQIKSRFPDKTNATILSEREIPYDILIKTMDATRDYVIVTPDKISYAELFPDLSIGDAPGATSVKVKP